MVIFQFKLIFLTKREFSDCIHMYVNICPQTEEGCRQNVRGPTGYKEFDFFSHVSPETSEKQPFLVGPGSAVRFFLFYAALLKVEWPLEMSHHAVILANVIVVSKTVTVTLLSTHAMAALVNQT